VLEPVAGDLVAGGGDRADQAGRAPCRARQHEEGAAPPARGEQVEDAAGRLGDAAGWIPGRRRDPAPVVHGEPVLDVDREPRGELLLDWSIYPGAYVELTWAWGAAGLRAGRLLGCFPPGGYLSVLREHPERLILVDRVLSATAGTATVALLVAAARAALGPGA